MKRHITALFPPEFHKNPAHFQALGLAFVYVTMAILQLFTFESFVDVTAAFGLPGGRVSAIVVAFLLPITEITALPYLLSMKLHPGVYKVSRVSVLIVAALWFLIALWTNATGNNTDNLGIFGATLYTVNQWWSVVFVGLLAWAAWLMYSARVSRSKSAPSHRRRAHS